MNDRYSFGTFRAKAFRLPAWQVALIGAAAAAIVITLALVSFGIFLLVFPAILLIDWVYRWRTRSSRRATTATSPRDTIITTEYEVLPPEPRDREPNG